MDRIDKSICVPMPFACHRSVSRAEFSCVLSAWINLALYGKVLYNRTAMYDKRNVLDYDPSITTESFKVLPRTGDLLPLAKGAPVSWRSRSEISRLKSKIRHQRDRQIARDIDL